MQPERAFQLAGALEINERERPTRLPLGYSKAKQWENKRERSRVEAMFVLVSSLCVACAR